MAEKSKKEWYLTWWGILLAILFLPFFGVWYVWAKTSWKPVIKGVVTGVIVIFILIAMLSGEPKEVANVEDNQTNPPVEEQKTTEEPQKKEIKYVFDVPSLVGKDIDGVKKALGKPTDSLVEPTAEQISLGTIEWSNTFEKDGVELLVTYEVNSRKIIDFFISGDDKAKIMEQGNLTEGDLKYTIEAVQAITDSSKITGIKATPNN